MARKGYEIMTKDEAKALGGKIAVGSIGERIFLWMLLYIPSWIMFAIAMSSTEIGKSGFTGNLQLDIIIGFLIPAIPFILADWIIRIGRRKQGFSPWKNVSEELKQRAVNERVAREMKAQDAVGGVKRDLNYWYALKEKGAITDKEYEAKKRELM